MSRACAFLLLLSLFGSAVAEEKFRFVRPVHVVQNKRIMDRLPPADVTTFNPLTAGAVADPPEVTIGERLFIDTRFSQYFAANYDGNVNHPLPKGDPILDTVQVKGQKVPGPFATRSINCRSCHFVAEFGYLGIGYNRTYADFAQRSPVPAREDGRQTTERNSMSMVDAFIDRNGKALLHADGEFASTEALIKSTITGRNFGWLPSEHDKAVAHIVKIIREDDGTDPISFRYGGSYAKILAGADPGIFRAFRLSKEYTLDVKNATDQQILNAVAKLMTAYIESLEFARNNEGVPNGSPYDRFLKINGLPAMPNPGETDAQYTARLERAIEALDSPKYVDEDKETTWFQYHQQKFNFGPQELEGLKIFLRTQEDKPLSHSKSKTAAVLLIPGALVVIGIADRSRRRIALLCTSIVVAGGVIILGGWTTAQQTSGKPAASVANCTTCHMPPDFTDHRFHNNGASQEEYDSIHGAGQFARLAIPSYEERQGHHEKYLPATPQHPSASGIFREPPRADKSNAADLGMWNIFANPDFPDPQSRMTEILCKPGDTCKPEDILPKTIARFRTPTLRDLADSSPFMHSGRFETVEDALRYYIRMSELARQGKIRNGAPQLSGIMIEETDVAPLAAFLRSLNEDYD